jgi:radical SAM superfamily enzyme YgiQ (UPF0313 family)
VKICFVDNLLLEQFADGFKVELQPHLGLISLIAVARAQGHEAVLYDPKLELLRGDLQLGPLFYGAVADRILAHEPDVVGFTSLGCNFACTLRIADELRSRRSDIPILLGGPHASILDREILERYPQFDLVVRNEAELTLPAVLDAVSGRRHLSGIEGITYRDERDDICRTTDPPIILDLDTLPPAAYDCYPIAELELSWLNVEAGRGCPFHCTFCSTASFFGRRYRLKSAPRLVADLDALHQKYGIQHFSLNHDLFTVNKVKIREFCEAVVSRGYTWGCSARIDCVDEELLADMRRAGCTSIYYGIETGSQSLQKVVSKNLDLALYEPIIEASLHLGIGTTASFITGYPNETPEDQEATLHLIDQSISAYPDDLSIQLHLLTPEPGTTLIEQFCDVLAYDGHINDFNFPPLDSRDEALVQADPTVFVCQQYYAAGCERAQNIAISDGYRLLYGLGHVLLRAMKDSYHGTLLDMFRDCGFLARRMSVSQGELIVAFIAEHWGTSHPLYDICKYIAAFAQLRPDDAERIYSFDATTPIRLARCIVPVGYTRNGYELGKMLHDGGTWDDGGDYAWYVLIADPELHSHHLLPVGPVTYNILAALRTTTTTRALSDRLALTMINERLRPLGLMGAIAVGDLQLHLSNHPIRVTQTRSSKGIPPVLTGDSVVN